MEVSKQYNTGPTRRLLVSIALVAILGTYVEYNRDQTAEATEPPVIPSQENGEAHEKQNRFARL